jgi:hypothetical protein
MILALTASARYPTDFPTYSPQPLPRNMLQRVSWTSCWCSPIVALGKHRRVNQFILGRLGAQEDET